VLFTLGVFMLATGGIWSYFRFRPSRPEPSADAGTATDGGMGHGTEA
jgi:hypothetical protein